MVIMKKFIIKWGRGEIQHLEEIHETLIVEKEDIDDVDPTLILPEEVKKEIHYLRRLNTADTKRNYDYGSWSDFIEVEEIKKD